MLSQYQPQNHPAIWKQILKKNFTSLAKLADFLLLSEEMRKRLLTTPHFPLNLPYRLAEKIVKGTLDDPIFKQFVPLDEESLAVDGFDPDPLREASCRTSERLLQKYKGRALLVTTGACAMHCRFCFRQHFDYSSNDKLFEDALLSIQKDDTINEVILSGGDPLSLDNEVLRSLLTKLSQIPHVRKVRFHTRFPIGIPERIDEAFLILLSSFPLQFWFVVHANHPLELDADVLKALKAVQRLGIPVLNQCVLLRGINDSFEVMRELCLSLVDHGISPYYVHQLDHVKGSAHFEVDEEKGKKLMEKIASQLPGYAVPRYVKEIPESLGKTPI